MSDHRHHPRHHVCSANDSVNVGDEKTMTQKPDSPQPTDVDASRSTLCSTAFEGGLFLCVHTVQMGDNLMICRDRYTVQQGQVCEVKCGKVTPTGDRIESIASLQRIGQFDPHTVYVDFEAVILGVKTFIRRCCQ